MPGSSECPDLFELPLNGDVRMRKWVFWGGNGHYMVGSFDGHHFTTKTAPIASNFGNTGYAAQTFFNDPKGRIVQISWLNNSNFPGTAWNQQMGFPVSLRLVSTPDGPRLAMSPIDEISSLRDSSASSGLMDVSVSLHPKGFVTMVANGHELRYDSQSETLSVLGKTAHIAPVEGLVDLRILVDRASVEIFGQHGLVYMPMFALPTEAANGFSVTAGADQIANLEISHLKSAW
jgi:sucrose-6-phosphate hydrolase SacC (GH32 family)